MSKPQPKKDRDLTIRGLYPELSDEELQETEENLTRYVELTLRVYERIRQDPEAYARFQADLTALKKDAAIRERSKNRKLPSPVSQP